MLKIPLLLIIIVIKNHLKSISYNIKFSSPAKQGYKGDLFVNKLYKSNNNNSKNNSKKA
jgi:hypothetical protein